MKKFRFISDPGHGWLEVPLSELIKSGVQNEVSSYSYYDPKKENVYLEEDCDAGLFIKAVGLKRDEIEDVYQENTFVRNLPTLK